MNTACSRCGLPHPTDAPCPDLGLPADPEAAPLGAGKLLADRYRIVRIIHHGATSVVYLAHDQSAGGRPIALKELRFSAQLSTEDQREAEFWFGRESFLLKSLAHPLMPIFYSVFREGQHAYIAQEYIEGETLNALVDRHGPIAEADAIAWGRALCGLLTYLHGQPEPVIFRDLKPANIILRSNTRTLVVVDFGIAKPNGDQKVGTTIGTPGYAPPEQYQGLATPESDIYALGATLHRLLTGYNPEQGAQFRFPPVRDLNPHISPHLASVVARAVQLDPAARYATAAQMDSALAELAPPAHIVPAPAPRFGDQWWPVVGGAFLLVLAMGFGLIRHFSAGSPAPIVVAAPSPTVRVFPTQPRMAVVDIPTAPILLVPTDVPTQTAPPTSTQPPPPPAVAQGPVATMVGDAAVAYQVSTTHDGVPPGGSLKPPLTQLWTARLFGGLSYPLIVGDAVFVALADTGSNSATLRAFHRRTGAPLWGPVDLGGNSLGLAYDHGRIFSVSGSGIMKAFSARSGLPLWSAQLPGQYMFSSAPTARNGIVYTGGAGSGGTVYALDESNGAVLWTAPVENGDDSSPVVTDTGVYVSYACNQVYDFAPRTGQLLWHFSGTCEGGGGATPVLHDNKLYTRDYFGNLILDAATGKEVGSYTATVPPTFDGTRALYLSGSTLRAVDQRTSTVLWSFAGDGALNTPPIAASGYVYIASSNAELYALEAASGKVVFSMKLPRGDTQAGALGAAQGVSLSMAGGNQTLVVSMPDLLVALQAQGAPKGGAIR